MPDVPQEDAPQTLSLKEERFALAMANGADKHKALEIAGYESKTKGSKAVMACKLLKRVKVTDKILDFTREILLAQGVTNDRIVANVAEIAFDKGNNKPDRLRSLELLSRQRGMLTDNLHNTGEGLQLNFTTTSARYPRKAQEEA